MKWFATFCVCALQLTAWGITYQERAVCAVLMGEARSDGPLGMTAVAEVIHQRALEKGRTPLQIISAGRGSVHAFSCLNGTTLDRLIWKFTGQPGYDQAIELAEAVCQNPSSLPGLAKSANHFTCATEHPYWAKGRRPVAIIGRHAFYRLDRY